MKAVSIRDGGKKSKVYSESISVNKSTFKPIKLLTNAANSYEFTGAGLLVDGMFGNNTNYKTGKWIGFQGNDLIAVIDMQEPTEISKVAINNAVVTGDWIFDASEVVIEASDDDESYRQVLTEQIIDNHNNHWEEVSKHTISFEPVTARYYKVTVKPCIMPEWHPGKGNRAFIFVDEIVLD